MQRQIIHRCTWLLDPVSLVVCWSPGHTCTYADRPRSPIRLMCMVSDWETTPCRREEKPGQQKDMMISDEFTVWHQQKCESQLQRQDHAIVLYLCLNKHCHLLPAFINWVRVGWVCSASAVTCRYITEGMAGREAVKPLIHLAFVVLFVFL